MSNQLPHIANSRILVHMVEIRLNELLAGRTLYWLSKETGIRWGSLADMANGKTRRLDLAVLDLICKTLDCQPGDLLVRVERKTRKRKRPASTRIRR